MVGVQHIVIALPTLIASLSPVTGGDLFKGDEMIPSDALILFDGKDLSHWMYVDSAKPAQWKIQDGYMEVQGGSIYSKQTFGDHQLHVEFWLPKMDASSGQTRANSGVYMHGLYEIQVFDSYGLPPDRSACGAIYNVTAPMVNACRPPERWQTFDILFRAPRFDETGKKIANAVVSVIHNGVWILDNAVVAGPTAGSMTHNESPTGPVMLQDHDCPVRYRNIWVRPL
ncbi:MAG: DUF1080 domain-containing protein [Armatimonadetes bacterium]|nr:DUF1080 domain-containing protein [Armatimonadota bacterium]